MFSIPIVRQPTIETSDVWLTTHFVEEERAQPTHNRDLVITGCRTGLNYTTLRPLATFWYKNLVGGVY